MTQIESAYGVEIAQRHPRDEFLRAEELPHVWCAGCGLGIVAMCLAECIGRSTIPLEKHVVISGSGCTAPLLGYLDVETYYVPRGKSIPFATGLKVANPELEVSVVACDSDLIGKGAKHLVQGVRQNADINVFCVNNSNYGMTGGQPASAAPGRTRTEVVPCENSSSFNVPCMVAAAGAPFVSRWTTIHIRQLLKTIQRVFQVQGFAFVEIVSPCPPGFAESKIFEDGYSQMEYFRATCRVDNRADLSRVGLSMKPNELLIVGDFIDHDSRSTSCSGGEST
jgi:2-oxoglutarate ferredoxin oxidoreductase subunit beta